MKVSTSNSHSQLFYIVYEVLVQKNLIPSKTLFLPDDRMLTNRIETMLPNKQPTITEVEVSTTPTSKRKLVPMTEWLQVSPNSTSAKDTLYSFFSRVLSLYPVYNSVEIDLLHWTCSLEAKIPLPDGSIRDIVVVCC